MAARLVAGLGDLARRAGGVGGDDRPDAELPDHLAALPERMHVALDGLDAVAGRAFHGEQLVAHRHEVLGNDVQPALRHQVMDVGDAPRDRVLDRDHAEVGLAGCDRRERVLERRAGQGLRLRIDFADREVRIRPRLTLECDFLGIDHAVPVPAWRTPVNGFAREARAPVRGLPRYRRRAARSRRWRRRSACRPRVRAAARASRVVQEVKVAMPRTA